MESFLRDLVLAVNTILSHKLGNFHRNLSFTLHSRNLGKEGERGKRDRRKRESNWKQFSYRKEEV